MPFLLRRKWIFFVIKIRMKKDLFNQSTFYFISILKTLNNRKIWNMVKNLVSKENIKRRAIDSIHLF